MSRDFFERLDELQRRESTERFLSAYVEVETQRAARNAKLALDPRAWRAAEIELRREGEFERAVYCQRVADGLEQKGDSP